LADKKSQHKFIVLKETKPPFNPGA
jgi:hypothetical protein